MQSSNGYLRILDIDRSSCRRVPLLILGSVMLAMAGLGLSGLHWRLLAPALCLVLVSGLHELRRAWPGSPRCVTSIRIWPDGQFVVGFGRQPQALGSVTLESVTLESVTLESVTLAHSWTIPGCVLGLAFVCQDRRRCQALLFRDQLPPDVWRRLRLRLRYPGA